MIKIKVNYHRGKHKVVFFVPSNQTCITVFNFIEVLKSFNPILYELIEILKLRTSHRGQSGDLLLLKVTSLSKL